MWPCDESGRDLRHTAMRELAGFGGPLATSPFKLRTATAIPCNLTSYGAFGAYPVTETQPLSVWTQMVRRVGG